MDKLALLLLAVAPLAACSSGPQPVHVPPSHAPVAVGQCAEVTLESQWDNRSPVPASGVTARCADPKICAASNSNNRAGVVYAQGLSAGATSLEIDFRDPVTGEMAHKAIRVTFVAGPDAGTAEPTNCDERR